MKIQNNNEIILVDDNEVDSIFITKCISKSKLPNQFLYFNSGEKFLDYMKKVLSSEAPMPAMILLDINMPTMNGFEVLSNLRRYDQFKNAPTVAVYSNSDNPRDIESAKNFNAEFIEKFSSRQQAVSFLDSLV